MLQYVRSLTSCSVVVCTGRDSAAAAQKSTHDATNGLMWFLHPSYTAKIRWVGFLPLPGPEDHLYVQTHECSLVHC